MIENAIQQLLSESAQKTLETMFFVTPDEVCADPQRPTGELIAASLTFQGAPSGRFGLMVSDSLAGCIAANFMGCDDALSLTPEAVAGVIGELSNMMCGSVLSELETDRNFSLGAPETIRIGADEPGPDFAAGSPSICRFGFPEGTLLLFFTFEEPA